MMNLLKLIQINTCKRCFSFGVLSEAKWFERNLDSKQFEYRPGFKRSVPTETSVRVSPERDYRIYRKFSEIDDLDERLAMSVQHRNLDEMTPIQAHTFDILSGDGADLLGSAETGSGKTLAFLMPHVNAILRNYPAEMMAQCVKEGRRKGYPLLLVLAPTRELAQQIQREASKLLTHTYLNALSIIGGESQTRQLRRMQDGGCHVLCATPGRLMDLVQQEYVCLEHTRRLVIDEGDRMLDMGFEKDIRQIVGGLGMPPRDQINMAMFSATFPRDVLHLVKSLMPRYTEVLVGGNAGASEPTMPANIEHSFIDCQHVDVKDVLLRLIDKSKKTLVFCNTKKHVAMLNQRLYRDFGDLPVLTSDINQSRRNENLFKFRTHKVPILISTNVAARGIDIDNIDLVLNFGMPFNLEDYVHRSGRSGRMGRQGKCVTLVTGPPQTDKVVRDIVQALKKLGQPVADFMFNQRARNNDYQRRPRSWGYQQYDRSHDQHGAKGRHNQRLYSY